MVNFNILSPLVLQLHNTVSTVIKSLQPNNCSSRTIYDIIPQITPTRLSSVFNSTQYVKSFIKSER